MTSVQVAIHRMLAVKPEATPYETFSIPEPLIGEPNERPHEHLEAEYSTALQQIVAGSQTHHPLLQPRALAHLVHEWLTAEPGRWFYAARECKSFDQVVMPPDLILPDLAIVAVGMTVDAVKALDRSFVPERIAAAIRVVNALHKAPEPPLPAFPKLDDQR